MSPDGPSNPSTPHEADLLAWVEGEALSAEANAAVAKALLADPSLARRLELMRSDRAALRSLGEERAPGGLMEAVEAALQPMLERELLLGLKHGEPADLHPVVSMVRPERRSIFQTFLADRAGRRTALAASLLVLIGGATWWATALLSGGTPPARIASVTTRETPESAPNLAMKTDAPDEGSRIAQAPEHRPPAEIPDLVDKTRVVEAPAAAIAAATAELIGPVRTPMDAALAAELARERKLVIRVVSAEAGVSPARVCDRIRKEFNAPGWKLASEVPTELAGVLEAKPFDEVRSAARSEPEQAIFAGAEAIEPIVGPPAPREIPVIEEAQPQPVYVVQARLDAATMSQLRTTLERAGRADEVVFEERYEALPLPSGGTPVLTPAAVLWWTNPPAGWTSWGEVPVVIEPR